jgi:hypothetical protein
MASSSSSSTPAEMKLWSSKKEEELYNNMAGEAAHARRPDRASGPLLSASCCGDPAGARRRSRPPPAPRDAHCCTPAHPRAPARPGRAASRLSVTPPSPAGRRCATARRRCCGGACWPSAARAPPHRLCPPPLPPTPADLYAIIVATEKLERAYVRDIISAQDYEPACQKLIAQFKTLWGGMRQTVRSPPPLASAGATAPLQGSGAPASARQLAAHQPPSAAAAGGTLAIGSPAACRSAQRGADGAPAAPLCCPSTP